MTSWHFLTVWNWKNPPDMNSWWDFFHWSHSHHSIQWQWQSTVYEWYNFPVSKEWVCQIVERARIACQTMNTDKPQQRVLWNISLPSVSFKNFGVPTTSLDNETLILIKASKCYCLQIMTKISHWNCVWCIVVFWNVLGFLSSLIASRMPPSSSICAEEAVACNYIIRMSDTLFLCIVQIALGWMAW